MEKAKLTYLTPQAARILTAWQDLGVKFEFKQQRGILSFSERLAEEYTIIEQPIPEGLSREQVKAMFNAGLVLDFDATEEWRFITFEFFLASCSERELLARLRIPEQPIPEKLLTEEIEWLPHVVTIKHTQTHRETDPHGTDPHTPGAKLDAGKNRLGLVLGGFAKALEEVGKVGTYGAQKYSPRGWKSVPNGIERYEDAMLRHWVAPYREGQIDPSTGLLHQAQLAWNALAVLELMLEKLDG